MLFERIESAGLAHYSYLIGDGSQAAVIDPRRDVEVYVEEATQAGMRISHVLETHRNEDYVIGSRELVAATSATVLRSGAAHAGAHTWSYELPAPRPRGHALGHIHRGCPIRRRCRAHRFLWS